MNVTTSREGDDERMTDDDVASARVRTSFTRAHDAMAANGRGLEMTTNARARERASVGERAGIRREWRRIERPPPSRDARAGAGKRGGDVYVNGRPETFDSKDKESVLSAQNLRKTYDGERYQFLNLEVALSEGQKVAVVGPNGSGKSTLLQCLGGREIGLEDGEVWRRKNLRVCFVDQEPVFDPELNVLEALYASDTPVMRALRKYDAVVAATARGEVNDRAMSEALAEMDALGAWDLEEKTQIAMKKLGCDAFIENKMGELSGGQRKRVALAAALVETPDLIILDEPTNHLSVEGVEWLEEQLQAPKLTVLLVSHDRMFIDNVCADIIELDGKGGSYRHRGGYSAFLEQRAERWTTEASQLQAAKNVFKKEQEWMRRMPKARGTKEKARIERFSSLTERVNYKGTKTKSIELGEVSSSRMGSVVVEFDDAQLKFGEKKILDGFSYAFNKGEKIGLVGPNGAGKTTLIRTILGEIPLDAGWVSVGETVSFGYYSQMVNFKDPTMRVVDYVKEIEGEAKDLIGGFAGQRLSVYTLLERFNFTDGRQAVQIGSLSGGEQRRLQMLTVLALCPNFLILDEPTNDLDLDTIESLEDMLSNFDGCVLIVSHDRQFVNNLADHIFVFDGKGGISDWSGTYSELRDFTKAQASENTDARKVDSSLKVVMTEEDKAAAKEAEKQKRELLREAHNAPGIIKKIEQSLEILDKEITAFDTELFKAGSDVQKALKIQEKKDAKVAKQELYYAEWERLEAVMAKAEEIKANEEAGVS